jgi:HlyD family secretion protein
MLTPESARSNVAMFRYLWTLLDGRRRRQLLWLQLVSLLMAFSMLGGIAAIVPFFSVLADPAAIDRHGLLAWMFGALGFTDRGAFLVFLGTGFVAMVVLANAINLAGSVALNRFALRLGRDFHVALYDEYLHRDYPFHLRSDSATIANKVINETTRVVSGMVQGGLNLVANLLACALIVASIVLVNPLLALATALLFTLSYAAIYFALRRRLVRRGQSEGRMWEARTRTLHESLGAIKEVLLRGSQARFRDAFAQQSDAIARVSLSIWTMSQAPRYLLECIMALGLVGAAFWLNRGSAASTWVAQLSFLGFAAYRLLPAVQQAFVSIARIRAHRSAFQHIAADLQRGLTARRAPPPTPGELAPWRDRPHRVLTLRQVNFRYAPGAPSAIRNFSAEIRRGQVTGVVGANGAGKTTLGDLILGLLRPESGSIEVDGIALDEHNLALWRHQVAYVPQHIFLLDASILENITLGEPREAVDAQRLRAALRDASLEELVASLPGGLDYRVGERGARLSGGQRQRLGIARALYHRASLLLLDEATSALDGASEDEIIATLARLRGDHTVIVIAHRTSTLAACDIIFHLERGALQGSGSYAELARRGARGSQRAMVVS